jgi:hypothetical protein
VKINAAGDGRGLAVLDCLMRQPLSELDASHGQLKGAIGDRPVEAAQELVKRGNLRFSSRECVKPIDAQFLALISMDSFMYSRAQMNTRMGREGMRNEDGETLGSLRCRSAPSASDSCDLFPLVELRVSRSDPLQDESELPAQLL